MRLSGSSPMTRFLRALHRRHVLLHVVERAGLGTLGGALVGLVLLPLLAWKGWPAGNIGLLAIGVGATLGLAWGVVRRPGPLAAAVVADRQLGLQDLLGTALVMHRQVNGADDPWAASVLAIAEDRCRTLPATSVSLRRLGGRAWGGIGLVTALAVALALFVGPTPDPVATQARASQDAGDAAGRPESPEHPLLIIPISAKHPALPGPEQNDGAADARPNAPQVAEPAGPEPTAPTAPSSDSTPNGTPAATPAGGGSSGTGQTHAPEAHRPDASPSANVGPRPDKARPGPTPSAGAGVAHVGDSSSPSAATPVGATAAGGTTAPRATPPWDTDRWPSDVQRARQALDSGQVPPAYRDIVRQYFARD